MGKHILIIDDEKDIREIAQLSLEIMAGWTVSTAASAIEGIAIAENRQPDAILLDLMMPDIDGAATLEQLRLNPNTQNIPAILLTARMRPSDRQRLTKMGIDGFMDKPFEPTELSTQIAQLLGW